MLRNTTRDHFARVFGQISRPGHLDTCQWFQNHLTNKLFSFTPNNNMLVPELYLQPNESTYPSFDDITMDPLMDATMSSAVSSTMGSTMTSTMTSSASVNWTDGNFSPGMRTDVELTMMQWVN